MEPVSMSEMPLLKKSGMCVQKTERKRSCASLKRLQRRGVSPRNPPQSHSFHRDPWFLDYVDAFTTINYIGVKQQSDSASANCGTFMLMNMRLRI